MAKTHELLDELRLVFSGRNSILDSAIPPLLFVIANAIFGFTVAFWISLSSSLAVTVYRLARRQPLRYALGGLGAVLLAIGLTRLLNSAQAYYLPALVNGALTVIVLLGSIVVKRPAVAFTSFITRRWPLQWYWHPQVRPAYSEVTAIWVVYSAIKLIVQFTLYQENNLNALAVFNLVSGWPALIALLVVSYVYGLKRLAGLHGPSVVEFQNGTPPPWEGQKRGF